METAKDIPVLGTPNGYAIRIHFLGENNWEISTNDPCYQEKLSGKKGRYNHYVITKADAVAFLEKFRVENPELERFNNISEFISKRYP